MTAEDFILAGLILVAGSMLQSVAGFGYGMFAIPLLMLLGVHSYEAISIVAVSVVAHSMISLWVHRSHANWKQIGLLLLSCTLMLPVGTWTLKQATALDPAVVRQIFGGLVLALLLVQRFLRVHSRERVHRGWGALAALCSGFMAGFAGMGGPPIVIWIMAHKWSNHRSRVTMWALFGLLTPIQMLVLWREFGEAIPRSALTGLILTPAALLGLLPGLWIGHHLSKDRLRQLSWVILLLVSLYALGQPLLSGGSQDAGAVGGTEGNSSVDSSGAA